MEVGLPRRVVAGVARAEAARIREQVVAGGEGMTFAEGVSRVRDELQRLERTALRPVINGTGVVLHTNLGRAPLGPVVAARVGAIAAGYSSLEIDLETGDRGRRAPLVDHLLAALAREMGIKRVLVSKLASGLCAYGQIISDVKYNYMATAVLRLDNDAAYTRIDTLFNEIEAQGIAHLKSDGFAESSTLIKRSLDMRYVGQVHECTVEIGNFPVNAHTIDQIKAANYNLDQKNPHAAEVVSHDPEQLLADYARLQTEAQSLRDQLKSILAQSLGAPA